MSLLSLKNLTVGYHNTTIANDLSLDVMEGEMLSLLGPSGEGKTTILKTIAGLQPPLAGDIFIRGRPVNDIVAEKRDVVLVFQKPLLFPFLNVEDNIGFGLRMKGVGRKEARRTISEMSEMTGLQGLEKRKIHQLSGGQQQRVALARGLVLRPAVLLLDEPLSNLDADLRHQMRELIRSVSTETGTTTMIVTHDQSEALMISDRVALLLQGELRRIGTPHELFYKPQDEETAKFFGCCNLIPGKIRGGCFSNDSLTLQTNRSDREHCTLALRPELIEIVDEETAEGFEGHIEDIRFEGSMTRLKVTADDTQMTILTNRCHFRKGERVRLQIPPSACHFIDDEE